MKTITVKLREAPSFTVEATLDAYTARPLVVLDSEYDMVEDINLSPIEAERLARALLKCAAAARELNPRKAPHPPTGEGGGKGKQS